MILYGDENFTLNSDSGLGFRPRPTPASQDLAPLTSSAAGAYSPDRYLNIQPDKNKADAIQAATSRRQSQYQQDYFAPLEDMILDELNDPDLYMTRVQDAMTAVQRGYGTARQDEQRRLARYGVDVPPEVREAMNRKLAIQQAGSVADAAGNTRLELDDQILNVRQRMIGFGRNLAGLGDQAGATAAQLQTTRDNTNRQISAQNQNAALSTGAALFAFAMMSMREVKEDIEPVEADQLARLLDQLKIVGFNYQSDLHDPNRYIGVLLEETPEAFRCADGQRVNLINILFAAVAQNQSQAKQILALEAKLEALTARLDKGDTE